MSLYLTTNLSRPHKRIISQFRIGNHHLNIETGRHKRPKIPPEQRMCHFCNSVEDESHFLIDCQMYNDSRRDYNFPSFGTSQENFIHVICSTDYFNLANFLECAFKRREEKLSLT